jgi:hypothetical protein
MEEEVKLVKKKVKPEVVEIAIETKLLLKKISDDQGRTQRGYIHYLVMQEAKRLEKESK